MGQFTTIHQNDQQSQEAWRECSNHGLRTIGSRATRRVSAGLCDWISAPHSKSAVGRGCPWSAKEVPPRFFSSKKKGSIPHFGGFSIGNINKISFSKQLAGVWKEGGPKIQHETLRRCGFHGSSRWQQAGNQESAWVHLTYQGHLLHKSPCDLREPPREPPSLLMKTQCLTVKPKR